LRYVLLVNCCLVAKSGAMDIMINRYPIIPISRLKPGI